MNRFFSDKLILIETIIIVLPLFSYYIIEIQNKNLYPDFAVNIIFITLVLLMLVFRSKNPRHMYYGFTFLILTILGDLISFTNFVYVASSLTVACFALGAVNMFLFGGKED